MMKKIFVLFLLFCFSGCSMSSDSEYKQCPLVTISRENARLVQKVNYQDDFEIELVGFEGYCFYDSKVKQEKAKITPIFKIRKLRNTDETDVQFSWFTNTIKGPPAFLGKKSYFVSATLKTDEKNKEFYGQTVYVRIPQEQMYDFEIFAGLDVSPQEKDYNQRLFDVDLGYME